MYDYILPLVEFPQDGDKFYINKSVNTISGYGSTVALTLGKYGMDVDFTGVVGDDEIAKKIVEIFTKYQVKLQYLETSYTDKTLVSYKIYNSKSNKFTSINEISSNAKISKYKYEFTPDVIVMDDKDYNANMAAINNFPDSLLIFIADKFNKQSSAYLNKCKYVISNLSFVKDSIGINRDFTDEKNLVMLFQRFIDLYRANLIIKLDNFDFLYCVNDEVRLIKNINKNITNKDSIYYSVLVYFLINNYSIEDSIKLTNKAMLESLNEIDLISDIPDYKVIETIISEYSEYKNVNQDGFLNSRIKEGQDVPNNNLLDVEQDNFNMIETLDEENTQNSSQVQTINSVQLHNPNSNKDIETIEQLSVKTNVVINNTENQNNKGVNNV